MSAAFRTCVVAVGFLALLMMRAPQAQGADPPPRDADRPPQALKGLPRGLEGLSQKLDRLPIGNLDLESGKFSVPLPFGTIELGRDGTRVETPFRTFERRYYRFPYAGVEASPPVPETAAAVHVELDGRWRVVVAEPRPPIDRGDAASVPLGPGVDLGAPAGPTPDLGAPAPSLGPAAPDLGDAAPFPDEGKPRDEAKGERRPQPPPAPGPEPEPIRPEKKQPDAREDSEPTGPEIPILQRTAPKFVPPAPKPESAKGPQDAGKRPLNSAEKPEEAGESPAVPSYLIVPMEAATRPPRVRVFVERSEWPRGGAPPPERQAPPPAQGERVLYELRPVRHGDVPRFFQPTAGLHVIAVLHPFTSETVCLQLLLPEGRPVLRVDSNDLEFDYGKLEVEVEFNRNGTVEVKYDT